VAIWTMMAAMGPHQHKPLSRRVDPCVGRTLVLSDTHLGEGPRAVSVHALRPLWRGCDRLILNGDVAEIHDPLHRAAAARAVLELQQHCECDGVELILLSGNHDPMLSDRRFIELGGGEIFITHGDVLHPAIAPWSADARQLHQLNRAALGTTGGHDAADLAQRLAAAQHASRITWDALDPQRPAGLLRRAVRLARTVPLAMWYWWHMWSDAQAFADRFAPRSRFFIFGHYHRAGIWTDARRVIVNTGCFSPLGRALAVIIEPQAVSVWPVRRRSGLCQLGKDPLRRFARASVMAEAA
jgi:predicted phosphodiesterase